MALSLFLAKLLGLYFLIAGGVIMLRQKSFTHTISEVMRSRSLIMLLGLIELAAGLAILIGHPIYTATWQGIITLIGAWMLVEALYYLSMPYTKLSRVVRTFNNSTWYTSGGLMAVVLGGYLAGKGFGLW